MKPAYSTTVLFPIPHGVMGAVLVTGNVGLKTRASLSLGGSGNGRGLHRHGSGGGLVVGVGGDLQPARSRRHQAYGVAGEQRKVLGVKEERRCHQVGCVGARGVSEQQVAAFQGCDGDRAA